MKTNEWWHLELLGLEWYNQIITYGKQVYRGKLRMKKHVAKLEATQCVVERIKCRYVNKDLALDSKMEIHK